MTDYSELKRRLVNIYDFDRMDAVSAITDLEARVRELESAENDRKSAADYINQNSMVKTWKRAQRCDWAETRLSAYERHKGEAEKVAQYLHSKVKHLPDPGHFEE